MPAKGPEARPPNPLRRRLASRENRTWLPGDEHRDGALDSQYLRGAAQVNELMTSSTFLPWHFGQTASLSRSAR